MPKKGTRFYKKRVRDAVNEAVRRPGGPLALGAAIIGDMAKLSMRSGGGSARTPSPVGSPPNVQEGILRSSIQWAATALGITWVVGPTEIYGKFHEFSEDFPRQFMWPAVIAARRKFVALFKNLPIARTRAGRWLNRQ